MARSGYRLSKNDKLAAIIIFVIAITLIVAMLPKQRQFKYELQKGKAWQYNDLYAPFDFAVLKTDAEIKAENDDNMRHVKPYFTVQPNICPEQKIRFEQEFGQRFGAAADFARVKYQTDLTNIDSIRQAVHTFGVDELNYLYAKGITGFSDVLEDNDGNISAVLVDEKVMHNVPLSEILTIRQAQKHIADQIIIRFASNQTALTIANNINLTDFIKANINYDKTLTTKARLERSHRLSATHGMVQSGQLIIARNELMNDQNLRVLESLRKEYQNYGVAASTITWTLIGQIMLIVLLLGIIFMFLFINRTDLLQMRHLAFIVGMMIMMIGMMCVSVRIHVGHAYVLPFVILPIILKTFYDSRLAFTIHLITIVICGMLTANGFEFILLQTIAGAAAIFGLSKIVNRNHLLLTVLYATLAYMLTYTAMSMLQEGQLSHIGIRPYMWFIINGLFLFVSYPLISVIEKIFGFVSDVTLLELSDTNHPLLRELAEKAPGTFQHVMQVANLAEEGIRSIGGNSLLTRVGALYHDIGKTTAPQFFIENQLGENPHDNINNEQSAAIIIGHVTKGIEIARANKLPAQIISFIATHHGTDITRYFYNKEVNERGVDNVAKQKFTYPGPSPFSKETAVLMLSDAIEAASRSLKDHSAEVISDLVDRIVSEKVEHHQMDNADITFRDIETLKQTFKSKLKNIYHTRIEYPTINK